MTDPVIAAMRAKGHAPPQARHEAPPAPPESHSLIIILCYVIFAATCSLSIYYSFTWFLSLSPWPVAALLALAVVGVAAVAPEVARAVKDTYKITRVLVYGIMAVAITFSMATTVGGIYAGHSGNLDGVEASRDVQLLRELDAAIEASEQRVRDGRVSVADYQGKIGAAAVGTAAHRDLIGLKGKEQAAIDSAIAKAAELRERKMALIEGGAATETRATFFDFIASVLGGSASSWEFLLAAAPAVFIDIVTPLMLYIAVGLRRRKA